MGKLQDGSGVETKVVDTAPGLLAFSIHRSVGFVTAWSVSDSLLNCIPMDQEMAAFGAA